jgi:hypothetical protein
MKTSSSSLAPASRAVALWAAPVAFSLSVSLAAACSGSKSPDSPSGDKNSATDTGSATGFNPYPYPTYTNTGLGTGTLVDVTPHCDPAQDFQTLEFPPPTGDAIRACLQSGKLYDFEHNNCTTMFRSTGPNNTPCTYDQVKADLATLGLDSGPLDTRRAQGMKLVGCGASNNGFTIVTQQWHGNPAQGCSYTPESIDTLCFRKMMGGETVTPSAGEDAWIRDCMQQ